MGIKLVALEGPDGGGKTLLATMLSELGINTTKEPNSQHINTPPRPKYPNKEDPNFAIDVAKFHSYMAYCHFLHLDWLKQQKGIVVTDRYFPISHRIYLRFWGMDEHFGKSLNQLTSFSIQPELIIYIEAQPDVLMARKGKSEIFSLNDYSQLIKIYREEILKVKCRRLLKVTDVKEDFELIKRSISVFADSELIKYGN